MGTSIIVCFLC
uniref:Uncharacterized protein n=1 Tax=Anguilla anguilla TaxID=7936 RepID=A0A0E9W3A7_ANGAN